MDETSENEVLTYIQQLDEWIHKEMNEDLVFKVMSLLCDLIQVIFASCTVVIYTRSERLETPVADVQWEKKKSQVLCDWGRYSTDHVD